MIKTASSIVFSGDIGFDKYMDKKWGDETLLSDEIYAFLQTADHMVANVEGALYEAKESLGTSNYIHTMPPKAASALTRMRADIWNICNNHSMDAGEKGVISTMEIAQTYGCQTLGAGLNEESASQPIIIGEAGGIGIISVGYHNECVPATASTAGCFSWDNMPLIAKRIAEIKEQCRWCVVVAHGGEEFAPLPLPYTRERYMRYLQMGADIVVGHHPHVAENYEIFEDNKMIFYSLGNFIFDTDYQRAHKYTDTGVLLKLCFSSKTLDFEAIGIRIDRINEKITACPMPAIFTNIPAEEYRLLSPLAAKAFLEEDARKMVYLYPKQYDKNPAALKQYFENNSHEDYVKGSHMDFDLILPLVKEYETMCWQNSRLEEVKNYMLRLL